MLFTPKRSPKHWQQHHRRQIVDQPWREVLGRHALSHRCVLSTGQAVLFILLVICGCQGVGGDVAHAPSRKVAGIETAVRDVLGSHQWPRDCPWRQDVRAMLATGRALEAAETMEVALLGRPDLVDAGILLGRAYAKHGFVGRSVDWLGRLAAARPADGRALKALLQRLMQEVSDKGIPSDSAYLSMLGSFLRSDIGRFPHLDWSVVGLLHQILGHKDRASAALGRAETLADKPRLRAVVRQIEAVGLLMSGDRLGARRALERAGVGEPEDPLGRLLLAIARGHELRDRDIIAVGSVIPEGVVHHVVGWLLISNGRRQDGMPHLRRAAELKPGLPGLPATVGAWLYENGRYQEAIPFLEEATKQEPDDETLPLVLLWAYVHANKAAEAIPILEDRVRTDPSSAVYRCLLGAAYIMMSQERKELLPKALEYREAAGRLGVEVSAVYYRLLAVAYLGAGEYGKALCEYADAIEMGAAVSWEKRLAPAMQLVVAEYRKGEPQPAGIAQALRRLAGAYPDKPLAHFALFVAYWSEDRFDDGLEEVLLSELLHSGGHSPQSPVIEKLRRECVNPEAAARRAKQRFQKIRDSASEDRVPSDKEGADRREESAQMHAAPADGSSSDLEPRHAPSPDGSP